MEQDQLTYNYKDIQVILGAETKNFRGIPLSEATAIVMFNRPKQLNSISPNLLDEVKDCFTKFNFDNRVNSIVLAANGRAFSAGLDVKNGGLDPSIFQEDPGRAGYKLYHAIRNMQDRVSSIEQCNKPVIAAINGICYGFGVDLVTACDIRFCSKDAKLSVKEIDIGMAADMGTLQRLPKIVSNQSWVREICYSAKIFGFEEALQYGLVSRIFDDPEKLLVGAVQFANELSEKSPIGLTATKASIVYSLDKPIKDGLEHIATRNMASLNSDDFFTGISSALAKKKPKFSKL